MLKKAINLYNKNLRYDEGGFLNSDKIYIIGNDKITADKRSGYKIKKIKNTYPEIDLVTKNALKDQIKDHILSQVNYI